MNTLEEKIKRRRDRTGSSNVLVPCDADRAAGGGRGQEVKGRKGWTHIAAAHNSRAASAAPRGGRRRRRRDGDARKKKQQQHPPPKAIPSSSS